MKHIVNILVSSALFISSTPYSMGSSNTDLTSIFIKKNYIREEKPTLDIDQLQQKILGRKLFEVIDNETFSINKLYVS